MVEIIHPGYYPLTLESLSQRVPSRSGIYMLAVRLANGVHKTFYTSQTDNLFRSLCQYLTGDYSAIPVEIQAYLLRYGCYFTYFVVPGKEHRDEIEKMLHQTTDPVLKVQILNCN